ncbi:4-hydroxy-tetrahydrodipicolinate synthase [Cucumibacter marinus]|uniref:4-hydroxy-tetrahydrodipicolinate synthase n=1 Tax=Cucumibacter marinus TaxID=1121252 RepID=UPI00040002E2|nr:4-hydroxy-tetrahydrodipicolinate synthase [Cucumibacter marinus]
MFSGSITALITPFRDGAVDKEAFVRLLEWQIAEGTHGVVPAGTTGESPTLTHEEHRDLIKLCVEVVDKRIPVIAGAGSNSTAEAIDFIKHAESVGADAVLSVTGYYNKPNAAGLVAHYEAIGKASTMPVFLYNIPPRTVIDISVETMAAIRKANPNVIGVKDATADISRVSATRRVVGEDFIQLSGEDITALGFNAHGGLGCISVSANVAPKLCSQFQEATLKGDYKTALALQDKLSALHKALFIEPNPAGVKYVASRLGICAEDLRLPLVPVSPATRAVIDEALEIAGLV